MNPGSRRMTMDARGVSRPRLSLAPDRRLTLAPQRTSSMGSEYAATGRRDSRMSQAQRRDTINMKEEVARLLELLNKHQADFMVDASVMLTGPTRDTFERILVFLLSLLGCRDITEPKSKGETPDFVSRFQEFLRIRGYDPSKIPAASQFQVPGAQGYKTRMFPILIFLMDEVDIWEEQDERGIDNCATSDFVDTLELIRQFHDRYTKMEPAEGVSHEDFFESVIEDLRQELREVLEGRVEPLRATIAKERKDLLDLTETLEERKQFGSPLQRLSHKLEESQGDLAKLNRMAEKFKSENLQGQQRILDKQKELKKLKDDFGFVKIEMEELQGVLDQQSAMQDSYDDYVNTHAELTRTLQGLQQRRDQSERTLDEKETAKSRRVASLERSLLQFADQIEAFQEQLDVEQRSALKLEIAPGLTNLSDLFQQLRDITSPCIQQLASESRTMVDSLRQSVVASSDLSEQSESREHELQKEIGDLTRTTDRITVEIERDAQVLSDFERKITQRITDESELTRSLSAQIDDLQLQNLDESVREQLAELTEAKIQYQEHKKKAAKLYNVLQQRMEEHMVIRETMLRDRIKDANMTVKAVSELELSLE